MSHQKSYHPPQKNSLHLFKYQHCTFSKAYVFFLATILYFLILQDMQYIFNLSFLHIQGKIVFSMKIIFFKVSFLFTESVQFSSVAQSCPTLCDPVNHSMPGLPVHHQLLEFTQIHVHRVGDAIQPSHPLLSPSPPSPNPSQHQSLFQWVNSCHEVAKVLEFQL